jgi:hypothetical protein
MIPIPRVDETQEAQKGPKAQFLGGNYRTPLRGVVKSEGGSPCKFAERGLDWERGYDFAWRKCRMDLYPMIEHFACNWMNLWNARLVS